MCRRPNGIRRTQCPHCFNASSNFDLTRHQEYSGKPLTYFDDATRERYLPDVVEPAAGLTRGVLALLCEAYDVDPSRPSPEILRLNPRLSPIKAGIFPLGFDGQTVNGLPAPGVATPLLMQHHFQLLGLPVPKEVLHIFFYFLFYHFCTKSMVTDIN